jgi:uncharacterized RDD family membrane protein YckC
MEMPTGYDLIEHSHDFRMHLLKRLAAGLIDAAAVFIPVTVVIFLAGLEPREVLTGTLTGFGWFFYSVISEARTGSSLGKRMMGLTVASKDGPMTLSKAVIRNVPKMFWFIFLPVDVLVGLSRDQDPRQRWVDSVSSTTVIKVDRK